MLLNNIQERGYEDCTGLFWLRTRTVGGQLWAR